QALELWVEARLTLGEHQVVIGLLEELVAEEPYRERLRELQITALYRAGRQQDALAAYQKARRALLDDLGVEPRPSLRELERAILRHDVSLTVDAPEAAPRTALPAPPTPRMRRPRSPASRAAWPAWSTT
ncbi:MAG: BTAD domain-containing putative transcriptional regulator, partial [Ramlibacter sp.]